MRNNRALLMACRRLMLLAIFAPGLASAAATAPAKGEQEKPAAASEPSAAVPEPNGVEGVTVNAPRPVPGAKSVPPEDAAAFAAEAAKDQAWRDYRKSTPPLTCDPNDLSKDFPGLQTYIPQ
jgi:hypothetical protein